MRFELRKLDEAEIRDGISFLKKGETLVIGDITISQYGKDFLNVIGWSSYSDLKNLTKEIVLKELDEVKSIYSMVCEAFSLFDSYQKEKSVKFELAFDSGKGGVGICSQSGEKIKWYIDI